MKKNRIFCESGIKALFSKVKPLPAYWNKEVDKSIHTLPDTITDEELKELINEIDKPSDQEKNSK